MELMEMAIGMAKMKRENKLFSNVKGNRNWAIRTERWTNDEGIERKVAYVSRYGMMARRGMFSEFVRVIVKYNIRWYEFTYKKDFEEAIKLLEVDGYSINWLK